MAEPDFRSSLNCRCSACGANAKDVKWCALGSSYENGHVIDGSMPSPCGPMVLSEDYEALQDVPFSRLLRIRSEAEQRFIAVLDAAKVAQP